MTPSPLALGTPTTTMAPATFPSMFDAASPNVTHPESPSSTTAHQASSSGARKSPKTCVTCRARKVRCDGRRDTCTNCERLGFTCVYEEPAANLETTIADAAHPPRRRVRQACINCHSRKARCSGTLPKCSRCLDFGLECVYRQNRRVRRVGLSTSTIPEVGDGVTGVSHDGSKDAHSPASGGEVSEASRELESARSPYHREESRGESMSVEAPNKASPAITTSGHELPDAPEGLVPRVLDSFFRHVHHLPMFAFLHRASLMQRHHSGQLDRTLLLGLIGVTTLLIDLGNDNKEYGEKCIDEAQSIILSDVEEPSIVKVQTLALIIKHRLLSGKMNSAFILMAIASRFAPALRLNQERPQLCFLAQESRRRLMWALYMIDVAIAGGHDDYALWDPESIRLQLPCNERNFEFDIPQITEPLVPPPALIATPISEDLGNLALHVRVVWLRAKILSFGKQVLQQARNTVTTMGTTEGENVATTMPTTTDLPAAICALAQELENFNDRLPPSFRYSDKNLQLRMYSPRIYVFVMMHILWRQCHLDLYRLALPGLGGGEALPRSVLKARGCDAGFLAECRSWCVENAVAMSDIFEAMVGLDTGMPTVADGDLSVCAFSCARILHASSVGGGDTGGWGTNGGGEGNVVLGDGMTAEEVKRRSVVCLTVARARRCCNSCPAVLAVERDLEGLMRTGFCKPAGGEEGRRTLVDGGDDGGSIECSNRNNRNKGTGVGFGAGSMGEKMDIDEGSPASTTTQQERQQQRQRNVIYRQQPQQEPRRKRQHQQIPTPTPPGPPAVPPIPAMATTPQPQLQPLTRQAMAFMNDTTAFDPDTGFVFKQPAPPPPATRPMEMALHQPNANRPLATTALSPGVIPGTPGVGTAIVGQGPMGPHQQQQQQQPLTAQNNAFEGAMEGFDFSLEPFGPESLGWFGVTGGGGGGQGGEWLGGFGSG